MSSLRSGPILLFLLCTFFILSGLNDGKTLTILNRCNITVWPALVSINSSGTLLPITVGALENGESNSIYLFNQWSKVILWGRTLCSEDVNDTGIINCITGRNNNMTSKVEFQIPPTTVAEIELINSTKDDDVYSVSLVEGFNIPMAVVPVLNNHPLDGAGGGDCKVAGCMVDLNADCPLELRVFHQGHVVGCQNMLPDVYSNFFKSSCPNSSYDVANKITFRCDALNYNLVFCPIVGGYIYIYSYLITNY